MYETDATFKTLANAKSRKPIPKVLVNNAEIDIISLEFEEPRESFVGGFSAKSVTHTAGEEVYSGSYVDAIIEPFMSFKGSPIEVPIGKFYVDKEDIKFDEMKKLYTITAFDSAIRFDKQYETIELPKTGKEIIIEICDRVGVEVDLVNLDTLKYSNHVFEQINISENENISYRQIINKFAQMNLHSAHISRDDKLHFKSVFTGIPVDTISGHDYFDLELNKEYKPINSLVYEQENVDDPVFKRNDGSIGIFGLTELKLPENLFMELWTREEKQDYIDEMFINVDNYIYHPFDSSQVMRPDFDSNDVIHIQDRDDNNYFTIVSNIKWTWVGGGLKGSVSCPLLPETMTDYTLASDKQDYINMGVKVDRVEAKITQTVQTIENLDGIVQENSSLITQTNLDLEQEIIDRTEYVDGSIDIVTNTVTDRIDGMESIYTQRFETIEGEFEEFESVFRYDAPTNTIHLGRSDNEIEMSLSNDKLQFKSKTTGQYSEFTHSGMYNQQWLNDQHMIKSFNEGGITGTIWVDKGSDI